MKLPNNEKAAIDERKIREYLLLTSHPVGRFKAKFFATLRFGPGNWQMLAKAIDQVAATGDAELVQDSKYGRKYLVQGALTGLKGRSAEAVSDGSSEREVTRPAE